MHQPYHLPVLFAEHCPDQPIIPNLFDRHPARHQEPQEAVLEDQISRVTRVITKKTPGQSSFYTPNIIKAKRHSYNGSHQASEHQREIKSMKKRIEDCKNIQQRRKDHNDPLLYPPYFIRNNMEARDARIDGYSRRILGSNPLAKTKKFSNNKSNQKQSSLDKNLRNSKDSLKKYQYTVKIREPKFPQQNPERAEQEETQMPSPVFNQVKKYQNQPEEEKMTNQPTGNHQNQKNSNANHHPQSQQWVAMASSPQIGNKNELINLPQCDVRCILDHVYNRGLYREQDFQILKSRMIHAYGKDRVRNVWKLTMQLLER